MPNKPPSKKCKHCGKEIQEMPYGAGWRWEHMTYLGTGWYPGGPRCWAETRAEPED